jgi:hypothetical protein
MRAVKLPARSPTVNAFAKCFVPSIKTECLHRLFPLGEAHVRRAILEDTEHDHEELNHQGFDNELSRPRSWRVATGYLAMSWPHPDR